WAANFVYSDNVFIGVKYDRNLNVMGDTLDTRGNGLLRHEYTFSFFESFDDEDSRKTATFLDFYDRSEETPAVPVNGGLLMKKFMGILNNSGVRVYADDIPVYRYADVVLMLAEVENLK